MDNGKISEKQSNSYVLLFSRHETDLDSERKLDDYLEGRSDKPTHVLVILPYSWEGDIQSNKMMT